MRKQPRAPVREGRPSSALGDADHRARKIAVPKPPTPAAPLDTLELTGGETETQVRVVEALNRLILEHNEGS